MTGKTENRDALLQKLTAAVEARAQELIADTKRIISFQTVSGGNEEQEAKYRTEIPACMDWLKQRAEQHGFRFRHWDHRVAEIEWPAEATANGSEIRSVGIASHIDVVTPVGTWKYGPFNATIEDGILYGRGIQDDKGPLIQSLHGMIALKECGVRLPFDVRIIIGTQEETGEWSDIEYYVQQRGAPDCSFTPDAEFPIIIGEKGMCNLKFRARWPRQAPNAETGMEFIQLKGGERSNIVPSLAEVRLRFPAESKTEVMKELVRETTRFTVEHPGSNVTLLPHDQEAAAAGGHYEALVSFLGKAAHSSTPDKGYNANADALRFFSDIETLPDPIRSFIQFLAIVSSASDGSTIQIESSHDFVGDTTAVLSLVKIGQDGGEALLNVRPTMGMPCQQVVRRAYEAAESFAKATGFAIEVEPDERLLDAIYLDPEKPGVAHFVKSLQQTFEAVTGLDGAPMAIGGTTYAKGLPNCCAFGPILPGVDEELAHQANERIAVESIKRNAIIYGMCLGLMAQE